MDPITLIVPALAAGTALGAQDIDALPGGSGEEALGGRPSAELVLARHEQALENWQAIITASQSPRR
jgi:hypothetical protein